MKKTLVARLTTGLLMLGIAGMVSASPAVATTWMIGDDDGYGLGIFNNADHRLDTYGAGFDGRTNGNNDTANEVTATNGAQFTDTYSTTHPNYSPQAGSRARFKFKNLGSGWTKGFLEFDMADFQAAEFGAVAVTYNGIPQEWAFNDGANHTKVRSFDLSQAVLDSINKGKYKGKLIVAIDRNGSEDYYSFDYARLSDQNTPPVPEPATMLLFGTGLVGLAAVGRRKRN